MSAAFVRRIPGLYLLIMSMLYAYPDFHFIGLIAICISIFVTIFHHPVVSISVGILTAMVNSFLTLAWISELSEFPSFMDGIHLFTVGLILFGTNYWAAYRMIWPGNQLVHKRKLAE
ncbi:MAG: hypothetical protein U0V54_01490 [Saprospiraceae bacterium]|nr:hypothetical protein [Saprospiraceae bacterium]